MRFELRLFHPLVLGLCFVCAAAVQAAATDKISVDRIPVCYDFGCKTLQTIALSDTEWRSVTGWFQPASASAEEERQRIRQAVGWMEVLVGRHTPTYRDVGQNLNEEAVFPGQLDCIDESLNTTTYLKLFENYQLLQWHRVVERAYRRAIFDQHWSGQVEEFTTGTRYVVDSWFHANGRLPYIQDSKSWVDIPFYTSYINSAGTDPAAPKNHSLVSALSRIFE